MRNFKAGGRAPRWQDHVRPAGACGWALNEEADCAILNRVRERMRTALLLVRNAER